MSRPSVAALFADLLAPATPATSATHATSEQRRGSAAHSSGCDTLRHLATVTPLSQGVAACRNQENAPQSEQRRGLSRVSQLSQTPGARIYRLTRARADDAHAEPWTAAAIVTFNARRDALIRRGHTDSDADDVAERLHLRDIEADDRVMCVECRHHHAQRCDNHRAAGLLSADVGRDLAAQLQRCDGFEGADDA